MILTIHANTAISVNGTATGYFVAQDYDRTRVLACPDITKSIDLGHEIVMPSSRYALSANSGIAEFERHFCEIWCAAQHLNT